MLNYTARCVYFRHELVPSFSKQLNYRDPSSLEIMAADFWAGYLSGAVGIVIGNPLDLVKVRLQTGEDAPILPLTSPASCYGRLTSLVRGVCSSHA